MAENYYHDLITHHGNWRRGLELLKTGDRDNDSHIDHEIRALDRLVAFHKEYSELPSFGGDPVALVAEAVESDKRVPNPLLSDLAHIVRDLHTALLDCRDDLRTERKRHQAAAAARDDLRAQLAALTQLPTAGRAAELAAQLPPEQAEIRDILMRVETNRREYELGRKVNAELLRQLEHEGWKAKKCGS